MSLGGESETELLLVLLAIFFFLSGIGMRRGLLLYDWKSGRNKREWTDGFLTLWLYSGSFPLKHMGFERLL